MTFIILLGVLVLISYLFVKSKGGEIPVDEARDINSRYFGTVLRALLKPALASSWGKAEGSKWRFGKLMMHRKDENVAVYDGNLGTDLSPVPDGIAALVVTGDLVIADAMEIPYDIWCLGNVTVGAKCSLRSVAADGYILIGQGTSVQRWLDAGTSLYLGDFTNVVAIASACEKINIGSGFRGGKVFAPLIRTGDGRAVAEREAFDEAAVSFEVAAKKEDAFSIMHFWNNLRTSGQDVVSEYDAALPDFDMTQYQWKQAESVYLTGDYWSGPKSVILHDLVCKGSIQISNDCVVAGSIHADKDLRLGSNTIVTGNIACAHLSMEQKVVVAGSVHVNGDAVLENGVMIGIKQNKDGLAVTGSLRLIGIVCVTGGISAGDTIYTIG